LQFAEGTPISGGPKNGEQPSGTIAALRDKIQRKNEIVAELMEEHVKLKKELEEL
jgi:transposase